jgi:hypothetical protein
MKTIYYILHDKEKRRYQVFKTDDAFITKNGCCVIDNCIVNDNFVIGYDAFYTESDAKAKVENLVHAEIEDEIQKFKAHLEFEENGYFTINEMLQRFGYFEVNPVYAVLAYLVNHNFNKKDLYNA